MKTISICPSNIDKVVISYQINGNNVNFRYTIVNFPLKKMKLTSIFNTKYFKIIGVWKPKNEI